MIPSLELPGASLGRAWLWLLLPLILLVVGCGTSRFTAQGWSGLTIADDILYLGDGEGRLKAVQLPDGDQLWSFPARDGDPLGAVYGAPAVDEERAYLAVSDKSLGKLYAVDLIDGAPAWSFPPEGFAHEVGALIGAPVVVGELVFVGSSDGNLYAVKREDGSLKWEFPTEGKVWSSPAVEEGTAYFGSLDHSVYAVDVSRGVQKWMSPLDGAVTGTPLVVGGTVYVGTFDRNLYALDRRTGVEQWRAPLDGWVWGGPVVDGRTIYAATLAGTVYALDRRNGDERWPPASVGGPVPGPPLILEDLVVVLSDGNGIYQLRKNRGTEKLSCTVTERVRAPIVESEGRIYLVDENREVRSVSLRDCGDQTVVRHQEE